MSERASEEQVKAYIEKKGVVCLYCGDNDIRESPVTRGATETGKIVREVECFACARHWDDEYELVRVAQSGDEWRK